MLNTIKRVFALTLALALALLVLCACEEESEPPIDYSIDMNTDFPINDTLPDGGGEKARVILLLGQSNASGCSIVEYLQLNLDEASFGKYERGFENVLINFCIDNHTATSGGAFKPVDLTCGCGNGFFGPEVGMAEVLSEKFPNEKVYILKFTMSGYSLANHWLRGGERSDIYNACSVFIDTYMSYLEGKGYKPSIDAICWMQGESDTAENNAAKYYDNQKAFIGYLRADLAKYNDGEIYFIDAGISSSPYCEPGYPTVNAAKKSISEESPYNLYFSTIEKGLTTLYEPDYKPDLGHYDALSELELGRIFGRLVAEIYD